MFIQLRALAVNFSKASSSGEVFHVGLFTELISGVVLLWLAASALPFATGIWGLLLFF
jgi:hypothetical protein